MVPPAYDLFFTATATVAGTLIGLVFVAISVRPSAAARTAHITSRLHAVAALSAFLNTLFFSLLALKPGTEIGPVATALGWIGLVAMVVLLVLLASQGRDRIGPTARGVLLVLGQGTLYWIQLQDGRHLTARPAAAGVVDNLAVIVVVLFAVGVARSWEFAGAHNPSLLATVATVTRTSATHSDSVNDHVITEPTPSHGQSDTPSDEERTGTGSSDMPTSVRR